ncbi:MAG: hypothetical protein R3F24_13800 [Gammaproteobacteria bacterium]
MTPNLETRLATAREQLRAAIEARDAAATAALEDDRDALAELRAKRTEVRAAEAELEDVEFLVETHRQAQKAAAARDARDQLSKQIADATAALQSRPAIARRMVAVVDDLRATVADWDAATDAARMGLTVHDELRRRETALRPLLQPCEEPLAGLLGLALPGLVQADLAFQANSMAGVDWVQAVDSIGRRAANILNSQIDEPEAA